MLLQSAIREVVGELCMSYPSDNVGSPGLGGWMCRVCLRLRGLWRSPPSHGLASPGGDSIDRSRPGWFPRTGAGAHWSVATSNRSWLVDTGPAESREMVVASESYSAEQSSVCRDPAVIHDIEQSDHHHQSDIGDQWPAWATSTQSGLTRLS